MVSKSKLSDFDVLNRIGKGSYGQVFRVRRKADGRYYVIKQVEIANLSRKEQKEAINEVRILASLDSPYIIRYYDSFIDHGNLNIVMELADGGNLHSYLQEKKKKSGTLTCDEVWRIFLQLLLGVVHIHSKNILHRDFKSLNVFLDRSTNVKIGDFGVSKVLTSSQNFQAQTLVGTPYYLSPELCENKPYNEKSDIWALGCILYELCTMKHPFDADNQGALILKIIRGKYPPIPPRFGPEIQSILQLCLARDSSVRPSATDLVRMNAVRQRYSQIFGGGGGPATSSTATGAQQTSASTGASRAPPHPQPMIKSTSSSALPKNQYHQQQPQPQQLQQPHGSHGVPARKPPVPVVPVPAQPPPPPPPQPSSQPGQISGAPSQRSGAGSRSSSVPERNVVPVVVQKSPPAYPPPPQVRKPTNPSGSPTPPIQPPSQPPTVRQRSTSSSSASASPLPSPSPSPSGAKPQVAGGPVRRPANSRSAAPTDSAGSGLVPRQDRLSPHPTSAIASAGMLSPSGSMVPGNPSPRVVAKRQAPKPRERRPRGSAPMQSESVAQSYRARESERQPVRVAADGRKPLGSRSSDSNLHGCGVPVPAPVRPVRRTVSELRNLENDSKTSVLEAQKLVQDLPDVVISSRPQSARSDGPDRRRWNTPGDAAPPLLYSVHVDDTPRSGSAESGTRLPEGNSGSEFIGDDDDDDEVVEDDDDDELMDDAVEGDEEVGEGDGEDGESEEDGNLNEDQDEIRTDDEDEIHLGDHHGGEYWDRVGADSPQNGQSPYANGVNGGDAYEHEDGHSDQNVNIIGNKGDDDGGDGDGDEDEDAEDGDDDDDDELDAVDPYADRVHVHAAYPLYFSPEFNSQNESFEFSGVHSEGLPSSSSGQSSFTAADDESAEQSLSPHVEASAGLSRHLGQMGIRGDSGYSPDCTEILDPSTVVPDGESAELARNRDARSKQFQLNRLLDRNDSLQNSVLQLRQQCIDMISEATFDEFYTFFKERTDSGPTEDDGGYSNRNRHEFVDEDEDVVADEAEDGAESSEAEIHRFVFGKISFENAEVITKIYQLLALEADVLKCSEDIARLVSTM